MSYQWQNPADFHTPLTPEEEAAFDNPPPPKPKTPRSKFKPLTRTERLKKWEELIRMIIRGKTIKECCELLGVSDNTIKAWRAHPEFQLRLTRTRKKIYDKTEAMVEAKAEAAVEKIDEKIKRVSYAALDVVASKMGSENENVALRAATDLLDRNPETSKTKKIQTANIHTVITADALVLIAQAAKELVEDSQFGRPNPAIDIESVGADTIEEARLIEGM